MLKGANPSVGPRLGGQLLLPLVEIASIGCNGDVDLPEISWSSDDFDFGAERASALCGGTLNFQQDFVDLTQGVFGQPIGGARFTYYNLYAETLAEVCDPMYTGCYRDAQVFSQLVPNHHEVTHAVVDLAIGRSHPFFNEGIAEVFRDGLYSANSPGMGTTVEEGFTFDGVHDALPLTFYARAGHFASYLLAEHGVEATVDVLRRARPGDTPDELKADLEASLGLTFAELLEIYAKVPVCKNTAYRWPITECAAAPVDDISGRWQIRIDTDCSLKDVIGPRVAERWTVRTIEVETPGVYEVTVPPGPQGEVFVELGHCSVGCAEDKGVKLAGGTQRRLALRAGRYYLSFVSVGPESEISIEIEPAK